MARYIVGIDLGTSNCAVASVEPKSAASKVADFPVVQLVRPGEPAPRSLLPSVVYLPADAELPDTALALPWGVDRPLVGELARWQGARVPGRVVTSAKSWLSHPSVDRQAALLPWGAPADVPRLSPPQTQALLLKHLAHAWDAAHPEAPLAQQELVITIPASFDEGARALTLQAARDAGLPLSQVSLLEEPQAAFYDFTARHRDRLGPALAGVGLALIVDVGGGTTDFSLVQVAMLPEGPALQRIAVGDHVLLGGDNMDAALARAVEAKLSRQLTPPQWTQALLQARAAKEALLTDGGPDRQPIVIAGAGSKLVGGTLSTELTRAEVEALVVDGFFPSVSQADGPRAPTRGGVIELGLPYATDAAITRHVVGFLKTHADAGRQALAKAHRDRAATDGLPRPDAILLNGGVFNSPALSRALIGSLSALWPGQPTLPLLPHDSLDLAVARGAAYSGLARRALGQRIGGGAPRAFYAAVSSDEEKALAVCLVPRGTPEGSTLRLSGRSFTLMLGKPVQFRLYSTTADRLDVAGAVVDVGDEKVFKPLPPLHTVLDGTKGQLVEVTLESTLSEVGTLALSCLAGDKRWRLEFELKGTSATEGLTVTQAMPARFSEATLEIERVFGTKPLPVEPRDVKNLLRTLERILGPREEWPVPVLRELWTALFAGASKRRRSPDHERVFFQLLGFSLRPGVGYPLDAWRCEQTSSLIKDAVTNHQEAPVWAEYWVLWRRIASGLTEATQLKLWESMEPHLSRKVPLGQPPLTQKLKGIVPLGIDEMVRCAAALELLPTAAKLSLGTWVQSRLASAETTGGPWAWALGRLGARVPVHGAAHRVLSPETAQTWAQQLLTLDPRKHDGALFALAQVCRRTGDRARDITDELRTQVLAHLATHHAPEPWRMMVAQTTALSGADEARVLGDTLPVGLRL